MSKEANHDPRQFPDTVQLQQATEHNSNSEVPGINNQGFPTQVDTVGDRVSGLLNGSYSAFSTDIVSPSISGQVFTVDDVHTLVSNCKDMIMNGNMTKQPIVDTLNQSSAGKPLLSSYNLLSSKASIL